MRKIISVIGLMMALGGAAYSNHQSLVVIKKAHKVVVNSDTSHKKAAAMLGCLLKLKKFETAEAAIADKTAKIKEKCATHSLSEKKCNKMQHKMEKKIHKCFMKKEFILEFFKSGKME